MSFVLYLGKKLRCYWGKMTLGIMTLSIMTLSIKTLSITTLSIKTLSMMGYIFTLVRKNYFYAGCCCNE